MAHVEKLSEAAACAYLSRFTFAGPCGPEHLPALLAGKACFSLTTGQGVAVYAVRLSGARLWVSAAAGKTRASICPELAQALDAQARRAGATRIAFQTARRGLVRRAQALGYQVIGGIGTGFILEKVIHEHSA